MSTDPSISDAQLRALLAGCLPEPESARIESALENDPELRARLEALSGASHFSFEFAPAAGPDPDPEREELSDLIRINGDVFAAAGCRFELPTDLRPRRRNLFLTPALIESTGNSRCSILNCELVAAGSGGIRFLAPAPSGPSSIRIQNSLFATHSGLELHRGTTGNAPFEVEIDRGLLCCRGVLGMSDSAATRP